MSNLNPYIIETALIMRISGSLASLQEVGSFGKYQARVADSDRPPLPAVYVMPDESNISDDGQGFDVENQLWVVSVLVEHSPDTSDTDTTAIRAGEVMRELFDALIGWRPTLNGSTLKGFKPMKFAGRATPIYAPGFGEFPVLFETGLVLTGN